MHWGQVVHDHPPLHSWPRAVLTKCQLYAVLYARPSNSHPLGKIPLAPPLYLTGTCTRKNGGETQKQGGERFPASLQGFRLCGLSISYQACGSTSASLLLQNDEGHMFWWAGILFLDVTGEKQRPRFSLISWNANLQKEKVVQSW